MNRVSPEEFKKELAHVRDPASTPDNRLRIEGYLKPHFSAEKDISSSTQTVKSIVEIFQHGLEELPLEIKTEVAAIQTGIADASNEWTDSLVYCVKPWAFLGYSHIKIAKPFGDSALDPSLIFLFSLSVAPKYVQVTKRILTASWDLVEAIQECAKPIGIEYTNDWSSIFTMQGRNYQAQGYDALRKIGLNLPQKPLFSLRNAIPPSFHHL